MLVLTRKCGEVIEIDGGIQVTVIELRGNRVRLGIEAPNTTGIRRPERKRREPVTAGEPNDL